MYWVLISESKGIGYEEFFENEGNKSFSLDQILWELQITSASAKMSKNEIQMVTSH